MGLLLVSTEILGSRLQVGGTRQVQKNINANKFKNVFSGALTPSFA